jgi:H+/Cl- antiporter ClcA
LKNTHTLDVVSSIGAIVIGVTGYFAPYTMGVGYDNIRNLLTGKLPLTILFSLFLLKYISWSVSLGSGTSGGTLAPLFTIGGAFGALAGTLILHFYPNAPVNITLSALIGMASMFAGASRALLTSILFAMETTGQSNTLLPLLGACIAAYFVSFFLMEGSIMTEKIKRRGVNAPDAFHRMCCGLFRLPVLSNARTQIPNYRISTTRTILALRPK